MTPPIPDPVSVRRRLLRWYDRNARDLPWRYKKGDPPDPYRVWLSEIMLQQTTVAAVKGYFDDFTTRWPAVGDLAKAELNDVLHAWQGLGYYARARNLHKCAQAIAGERAGRFPDTEPELKALPGIGDYTAAAIAAIAFDRRATPVDANIERVTARLFALGDTLPKGRKKISERASLLTPKNRPGDFAQALMDLGAGVCTPKAPDCSACPLTPECLAAGQGEAERYPVKVAKAARPVRYGMVFWAVQGDGRVLLRQRPEKGLLGGMTEFPSTDWRKQIWSSAEAAKQAPVKGRWRRLDGVVRHTFTHFHLELTVLTAEVAIKREPEGALWSKPSGFSDHALPTVMKKIADHASRNVPGYSS
ncbi:MAG: A/G-specific adenine glycosylase [Rhodospirillales bacterium]|nr:A/G-specific adenine glycosylase [Alphaproteobacteria bacterium]MBL6947270.1 A/G-specific adenine glycosylase [Rhodospirillales bacterium]